MTEPIALVIAGLRTVFGQVNATMMLLFFFSTMQFFLNANCRAFGYNHAFWCLQLRSWMTAVLIIAALFYPLALGLGRFDPYALGYDVRLLTLCAICALAAAWRHPLLSIWLAFAAVAHAAQWGESNNLWDYLFDPLSIIWILIWWLRQRLRGFRYANYDAR